METHDTALSPLDKLILTEYPYPIAVGYRRVLEATDWPTRVNLALRLFEYGLRTLALGLISQYLIRDADTVSDPALNKLLLNKLPRPTLGNWKDMLFTALKAYADQRDLFFMPELYDLYWKRRYEDIQRPYDRLIQVRNDLAHRPKPTTDAAWQILGKEVMTHLREVLGQFTFLQHYDLMHIVTRRDNIYECLLYTGEHRVRSAIPLITNVSLEPKQFYLSKGQQDFLAMYPLLIFWEDPTASDTSNQEASDTGLYDTFTKTSVNYILTVLQRMIQDRSRVGEFVRLLYYTIEQEKHGQPQRLTWHILQDIATQIAEQRFEDVRAKYQQEVYLQRQDVKAAFEDFLASDKTAFLLLGKSGVGKSNFILSIAEEHQADDYLCLLLYNGAKLDVDRPLSETIGADFGAYLRRARAEEKLIDDLVLELADIEGIDEHQVILFIDAVNENTDARGLLRRINQLIETTTYPWFKVVFSSRPEAWRVMKRGVKLAEHRYYRMQGAQDIGVELEPFTYGVTVKEFTRAELPQVYAKYQQVYNLQTPYEVIPVELRSLLNDPLTLKLVAETYRNTAIPKLIRLREIYEKYVAQMIRDERLRVEDTVFLEEDLLPLMISASHYENAIPADEVNVRRTASGRRLFELIHNDEHLSNGDLVNQSYINLASAEILLMRGSPVDYEIGFKYERFYDYYAGKHIYKLSTKETARTEFFLDLIGKTIDKPFLWGPVMSALAQDAQTHGVETILSLCYTDQQRVKEMMTNVLIDVGRDDLSLAGGMLHRLLPLSAEPTDIQRAWQLIRKPQTSGDKATQNARKIAVEVAGELGVVWVLQAAALQTDAAVRAAAVRSIYHLWQHDRRSGYAILGYIADHILPGLIPSFAAFEGALGLTFAILFDHPRDEDVLAHLQSIWRPVIAKILFLQGRGGRVGQLLRDFIREQLISFIITLSFRLVDEIRGYTLMSYKKFDEFFRRGAEEKALYSRLTHYLDVDGVYDRDQMEQDFRAALMIPDLFIGGALLYAQVAHMRQTPLALFPRLKRYVAETISDARSSVWLSHIPGVISSTLELDPKQDEIFDYFVYNLNICQEYYAVRQPVPDMELPFDTPEAMYLDIYTLLHYQRTGTIPIEWIENRINAALSSQNSRFFDILLKTELPLVAIDRRRPQAALQTLALFFDPHDPNIGPRIVSFLARLRVYYPDQVDDFLEEHQAPQDFRLAVRTNEPAETMGDLIGDKSWNYISTELIAGPQVMRDHLIGVLDSALRCKNMRQWVDYIVREVVNVVYGEEVLHHTI